MIRDREKKINVLKRIGKCLGNQSQVFRLKDTQMANTPVFSPEATQATPIPSFLELKGESM